MISERSLHICPTPTSTPTPTQVVCNDLMGYNGMVDHTMYTDMTDCEDGVEEECYGGT